MNYYKRHIGDYAKKAGHLSTLEHGVYTLLLDAYYDREIGPTKAEALRQARARTPEEVAAVEAVLGDFFTLDGDRYIQKRVEEEFALAAEHARKNAENGKRGGRPRKANRNRIETQPVSGTNPSESEKNPNPLIHQSTNPSIQKKEQGASPIGSRLPADWTLPDEWRAWAKRERPELDIEREADSFADYWHGLAGAKGRKADWLATWRNWIRNSRNAGRVPSAEPVRRHKELA